MGTCESLSVTANCPLRRERFRKQHNACGPCVLAGCPLQEDPFDAGSATKPLGLKVVCAINDHARTRIELHRPSFSATEPVCARKATGREGSDALNCRGGRAGQKSSSVKPSSGHLTPASSGVSQLNSYTSAPPLSG